MGLCFSVVCTPLGSSIGRRQVGFLWALSPAGTSDPYCRVALVRVEQANKPHRDLAHWEEKKVVNNVEQTAVVLKSLTPEWRKDFQL